MMASLASNEMDAAFPAGVNFPFCGQRRGVPLIVAGLALTLGPGL